MPSALFTAATGMHVQQQNVDNIAHNLANASTVGFKRTRLEFQDILYQNIRTPGAASNASTMDVRAVGCTRRSLAWCGARLTVR